ncbi:hypothetical protein P12x_002864 [Tundrisphaera lichenicola]|uniref:hypothetical protein n=1 Tax=Tundrisphaera lichenicola TaxID=2029860 RepID=UPI003EB9B3F3
MEKDNRGLTLFDLICLVAATAVGIVLSIMIFNSNHNENFTLNRVLPLSVREWKWSLYYSYNWLFILSPMGISWTVTISLLTLRKPRPTIGQLTEWPGVSACWMASLTLAASCGLYFGDEYRRGNYGLEILGQFRSAQPFETDFFLAPGDFLEDVVAQYIQQAIRPIACSVCSIWTMAAMGRRWRPKRNWLDLAGRSLGLTWILYVILEVVVQPL